MEIQSFLIDDLPSSFKPPLDSVTDICIYSKCLGKIISLHLLYGHCHVFFFF